MDNISHLATEWRGRVKKAAEDFLYCFYISGCAYHELPYSRLLYSLRNWNIDYTRALKLFGRLGALAKRGKCSLLPIEKQRSWKQWQQQQGHIHGHEIRHLQWTDQVVHGLDPTLLWTTPQFSTLPLGELPTYWSQRTLPTLISMPCLFLAETKIAIYFCTVFKNSQKKSHFIKLRAKRVTFTFWVGFWKTEAYSQ